MGMDKENMNEQPKAETNTEEVKERPKKKKSITAVYNPQNSKLGGKGGQRGQGQRSSQPRPRRSEGGEDGLRGGMRYAGQERPVRRPEGARPARPDGTRPARPARPEGARPARPEGAKPVKPATEAAKPVEKPVVEEVVEKVETAAPVEVVDAPRKTLEDHVASSEGPVIKKLGHISLDEPAHKKPADKPQRKASAPRRDNRQDKGDGYEKRSGNYQKDSQGPRGGRNNSAGGRSGGEDDQNRKRKPERVGGGSTAAAAPMGGRDGKPNSDNRRGDNKRKSNKDYEKKNRNQEQFINLEKKTGHKKKNAVPQAPAEKKEDEIKTVILPEVMTIKEFADIIKVNASDIIKKLFMQGMMVTVNQEIDFEKAEEIAMEYNCICEPEEKVDVIAELLKEEEEDEDTMVPRAPVVCVMGHVDHGKTSLLDAIRKTRVTDKEAGGITQHIGASVVDVRGRKVTFLDTPGHEAFTAMRMRGANSTDIAILVVAADDGIMPQTVEAINHAKAAGIEIVVAINKIDREGANIDRVKQGLTEYELIAEDWGGSTICVPVSAKTGEGIPELLDMLTLTADILELKANPKRNARGLVIEAQLDKGRGAVATVLVQKGTLKVGQAVAAGASYGKVRAMIDDKGRRVKEAGPSIPVEILGLNNVPNAGEVFVVCDSEKDARSFADTFVAQNKEKLLEETRARMSLEDLFSQIQTGNLKELNLIVKADVQGSVEAVKQSLMKLSNEEVMVKVIHGGVGAINESDVTLASASNAIIIGFNVKPDAIAKSTAEQENVDIRLYSVIYKAIEDIEAAMKGMLDPIFEERVIGHAEIRQIFKASGVGNIAGSYVLDGVFERGCMVRISRAGEQIFEGNLASLKRFKDDVKEVKAGFECGLVFEGFNDIEELDIVEAYKMVEVPR